MYVWSTLTHHRDRYDVELHGTRVFSDTCYRQYIEKADLFLRELIGNDDCNVYMLCIDYFQSPSRVQLYKKLWKNLEYEYGWDLGLKGKEHVLQVNEGVYFYGVCAVEMSHLLDLINWAPYERPLRLVISNKDIQEIDLLLSQVKVADGELDFSPISNGNFFVLIEEVDTEITMEARSDAFHRLKGDERIDSERLRNLLSEAQKAFVGKAINKEAFAQLKEDAMYHWVFIEQLDNGWVIANIAAKDFPCYYYEIGKDSEREYKGTLAEFLQGDECMDMSRAYEEFIEEVARNEEVWTLGGQDGWVTLRGQDAEYSLVFWGTCKKAEKARDGVWEECRPESIHIDQLLGEMLDELVQDKLEISLYIDEQHSILMDPKELKSDLLYEQYEIEMENIDEPETVDEYKKVYVNEETCTVEQKKSMKIDYSEGIETIDEDHFFELYRAPKKKRYEAFVKMVCDYEGVYALKKDGEYAMLSMDEKEYVPFWPTREYAQYCAVDSWEGYEVECVNFEEWRQFFLIYLLRKDIHIAVFPTRASYLGVKPVQLLIDIEKEMSKYA
ncbi:DUF2750 domain-containing protein [Shouchella lonarensis]|uniref:DUF2750 domain-containing protein n=1 Tax=Shouchella lonarensis TaxID=1464122 RepID=A0A1G6GMH2_9BACI|nr:DUF2750 domain-containing protein [Shouchella lonarensis]SDB82376.1 Protein of unknown function [Shouchella lonarensis]